MLYYIILRSSLFHFIPFFSILFYSIPFYSILFFSSLFYSILFCSILQHFIFSAREFKTELAKSSRSLSYIFITNQTKKIKLRTSSLKKVFYVTPSLENNFSKNKTPVMDIFNPAGLLADIKSLR